MTALANSPEFHYQDGQLHVEALALAAIAQEVGTPFYCYSSAAIRRTYDNFASALRGLDPHIAYAMKANGNLAVIATFAGLGAGADVVSEGEVRRALAAGVPPAKIVFSGVGKTEAELEMALQAGVLLINVESEVELDTLSAVAVRLGVSARVALRVNPDVDPNTHAKISTGRKENKFGIDTGRIMAAFARAVDLPGMEIDGLAIHIGSQLTDIEPFRRAFTILATLVRELRGAGHTVRRLDLGGGLGIAYGDEPGPSAGGYAELVRQTVGDLDCQLTFEPGRALIGNAGVLVTAVILVKDSASRRFIVLDSAMNDLTRPSLYSAEHAIVAVAEPAADAPLHPFDIVGPICETGDTFATGRSLAPVRAGDLLAICSAGAYGAVMASSYNARLLIPEVLVDDGDFAVVRRRPTFDEMLDQDYIPDWIEKRESSENRAPVGPDVSAKSARRDRG
ncbi:MAG: diaminopimelate decarboxylase [Alphaproteobacteria bacterium]|nr:diaminopimelate decarboxylase [Alphaproteobacteria bacterium]